MHTCLLTTQRILTLIPHCVQPTFTICTPRLSSSGVEYSMNVDWRMWGQSSPLVPSLARLHHSWVKGVELTGLYGNMSVLYY